MSQGFVTSTEESVSEAALSSSAAKLLPSGTVLISIFATIGQTAVLGIEACTNQAIAGVTPRSLNEIDSRYLQLYLDSARPWLISRASGVAQLNITSKILKSMPVLLPPLSEQRRISEVLDRAEALRAKRREALAQLDELAQSIFLDMFVSGYDGAWPIKTIEDVARQQKGSIRTGPFGSQLLHEEFAENGPAAVLGIDNAASNSFAWASRRFITQDKYQQLKRYTVYPGDVLITIMGTCGRCAVVPPDTPTAISTKHLCCITLDTDKCVPNFLHACFLQHPIVRNHLNRATKGSIMSGLNMGIIKETPIPLPSLEFQKEFVQRVESAEQMKMRQLAQLTELDALFASLQQRAFRGEL